MIATSGSANVEENHAMSAVQQTEELALTPTQIEGPYYKVGSPQRSSLIEPGISGIPLVLTGQVLNERGAVIPGAVLDFWQSDERGNYDMVGNILRGHVFTDQDGRYSLETIVPACYEPRQARHIHVKVQGVSRPYTTQLYFSDDPDRVKDNYYLKELEVQVDDLHDGRKRGQYDFVIRQVTEKENVTPESLAARVA
jgi:protocatechuate 3,4-dioxygenase beta subunit